MEPNFIEEDSEFSQWIIKTSRKMGDLCPEIYPPRVIKNNHPNKTARVEVKITSTYRGVPTGYVETKIIILKPLSDEFVCCTAFVGSGGGFNTYYDFTFTGEFIP